MDSYIPSLADLEARLAKLERQNRRWKYLAFLCLVLAGSGFLLAQAPRKSPSATPAPATRAGSFDTLVVHRLELRDNAGKLLGLWDVGDEGSLLALYDTGGKPRAALALFHEVPRLTLHGTAGEARAELTAGDLGPDLTLVDAQGFQAVVGVTELERPATGESHKTSAAAVTLFGKDGKVIWRAP
jgi:hypothetical protein